MTRVLLAFLLVFTAGAALGGCRAEIDADDHSQVGVPR